MGNNCPKIRVISFQVRKIVLENLGVKPWRLKGKYDKSLMEMGEVF
jgi:hypothetical protein